jgi:hypothetical protein
MFCIKLLYRELFRMSTGARVVVGEAVEAES